MNKMSPIDLLLLLLVLPLTAFPSGVEFGLDTAEALGISSKIIEPEQHSGEDALAQINQLNRMVEFQRMKQAADLGVMRTAQTMRQNLNRENRLVESQPLPINFDFAPVNPFLEFSSDLREIIILSHQWRFTRMDIDRRNAKFLENVPDIEMITSNVNNELERTFVGQQIMRDMKRLAGLHNENNYVSARDSLNAVWLDEATKSLSNPKKQISLQNSFIERFKLNEEFDIPAIMHWTQNMDFVVSNDLTMALSKISPFEGIGTLNLTILVIRNTNLDDESLQALNYHLDKNLPIPMKMFVKNTDTHFKHIGVLDSIMSTVPAGKELFEVNHYSSRLVVYSRNGRLIAPILSTYHTEMEVLMHSKLSMNGFHVLGKGLSKNEFGDQIDVWFLEEIK